MYKYIVFNIRKKRQNLHGNFTFNMFQDIIRKVKLLNNMLLPNDSYYNIIQMIIKIMLIFSQSHSSIYYA